jgi:hypothetical protein
MMYRVRQFWAAVRTNPLDQADLTLAKRILTEEQMALFSRLQPSEQVHGLRVLQTLRNLGEDHPDLLTAALLHDIGKIKYPLQVWERVIIVIVKRLARNKFMAWGNSTPSGWKRPFVVAVQHPDWGASFAAQADTNELATRLIKNHQKALSQCDLEAHERHLLGLLQEADNQN